MAVSCVRNLGAGLLACGLLGVALGCGAAPSRPAFASEPTLARRASLPRAAPEAYVPSAGDDAARATLFALLEALLRDDLERLRRLIAPEPLSIHLLRSGRTAPQLLPPTRREVAIQRMTVARRAAPLPPGTTVRDIVEPTAVELARAAQTFGDALPEGLVASDVVVRFRVDDRAEAALRSLAVQGRGMIIVRVAPDGASIVGL